MEISPETRLRIYEKALHYYEQAVEAARNTGMCSPLSKAYRVVFEYKIEYPEETYEDSYHRLYYTFPEFREECPFWVMNAEYGVWKYFWWALEDTKVRVKVFRRMISKVEALIEQQRS